MNMGKGKVKGGRTLYVQRNTRHLIKVITGHHNIGCKDLEDAFDKAWEVGDEVSLAELDLHGYLEEAAYYLESCTIL